MTSGRMSRPQDLKERADPAEFVRFAQNAVEIYIHRDILGPGPLEFIITGRGPESVTLYD